MDRYRKIKIVGKGSFGYAVLVHHVSDKSKTYIMKIIDISKMEKKQRNDALNEVKVLKTMRHPYIVTYRESFIEKSYLCIVMDFADGGDLYQKINEMKKKGEEWSEAQILDSFVQMALALKHVHDQKIMHRDLKTQNIFLTSKGEVKIGDFGIARVLQHTYDCAKTAIGTPYYLSPEICQEKPYNHKSDVWSLGCILYEMLTLNHAFDASSMKGLVLKILRGTYPPISSKYSENMRGLLEELLQKDPEKRPSIKKVLEKEFLNKRIGELLKNTLARSDVTKQMQNGFSTEPHRYARNDSGKVGPSLNPSTNNSARSEIPQPMSAKVSFLRKGSIGGENEDQSKGPTNTERRETANRLAGNGSSGQIVANLKEAKQEERHPRDPSPNALKGESQQSTSNKDFSISNILSQKSPNKAKENPEELEREARPKNTRDDSSQREKSVEKLCSNSIFSTYSGGDRSKEAHSPCLATGGPSKETNGSGRPPTKKATDSELFDPKEEEKTSGSSRFFSNYRDNLNPLRSEKENFGHPPINHNKKSSLDQKSIRNLSYFSDHEVSIEDQPLKSQYLLISSASLIF